MDTKVSIDQIRIMKHAIGYEPRRVKRGKYIAWRNYFVNGDKQCEQWDELVDLGLAVKYGRMNQICYYVSDKGIEFLASLLGIRIVEERD